MYLTYFFIIYLIHWGFMRIPRWSMFLQKLEMRPNNRMASELTDSGRDLRVEHLLAMDLGDFDLRRQHFSQPTNNIRTTTRFSRFQSKTWNRQSIQIFTDFNTFDSLRGSRCQGAAERDDEEQNDQEAITSRN